MNKEDLDFLQRIKEIEKEAERDRIEHLRLKYKPELMRNETELNIAIEKLREAYYDDYPPTSKDDHCKEAYHVIKHAHFTLMEEAKKQQEKHQTCLITECFIIPITERVNFDYHRDEASWEWTIKDTFCKFHLVTHLVDLLDFGVFASKGLIVCNYVSLTFVAASKLRELLGWETNADNILKQVKK